MPTIYVDRNLSLPERRDRDFYPTPYGFCVAALHWLDEGTTLFREPDDLIYALDPGCGDGVWGRALKVIRPMTVLMGVDIRDTDPDPHVYDSIYTLQDYFGLRFGMAGVHRPGFNLILGNPPYKQAEAFVRHSLSLLAPGGSLMFLMKLQFLEGLQRRAGLFREFPPARVGVVSRRISFSRDKKTNADAHALIHWIEGRHMEPVLNWLTFTYAPEDIDHA